MASTYSPLLRLELMANGEKSGQWGTITNTNLSTVLEQAIAGTTTIDITSQTSPITLTANDGSSDQSRAGILLITGTNASNMNIVAPAVSKVYVVNNTSNRSVTIKTSSSTGVTIPTNTKQIIAYNTSTTDFEAITQAPITSYVTSVQVSGGTTGLTYSGGPITSSGTITMAGTLALANGGTGETTQQGAINALLPGQGGQGGKFLTTDGTNVTWATVGAGSGSVSSVNASGGSTGLTFSGGPITTSGTLTLGGTLDVDNGGTGATSASGARTSLGLGNLATLNSVSLSSNVSGILPVGNGGTGVTAYSNGQLLIGNSSGTLSASTLTAGSGVTITNGNGSITIASSGSSGGGITTIPRVAATGSSVVITGIPSGVKRITILLDGLSSTASGSVYAGLGTVSGGTTAGSYAGTVTSAGGTQAQFPIDKATIVNGNASSLLWSGTVTFCNAIPSGGANLWTIVSCLGNASGTGNGIRDATGDVSLDISYVNRVFVSLSAGAFDNGGITVFYES